MTDFENLLFQLNLIVTNKIVHFYEQNSFIYRLLCWKCGTKMYNFEF